MEVLVLIRRLYRLESAVRKRGKRLELDAEVLCSLRKDVRSRLSRRVMIRIKRLVAEIAGQPSLLPRSLLGKAVGYFRNQGDRLEVFLDHAEVEIDNNAMEREIRSIAVGRKNWMFTGSARGGKVAAELYSLMNTCRSMDINAEAYLTDVLQRLSTTKSSQVADLTPWAWRDARANQPT